MIIIRLIRSGNITETEVMCTREREHRRGAENPSSRGSSELSRSLPSKVFLVLSLIL